MKTKYLIILTLVISHFYACTNGQTKGGKTNLSATEFAAKIAELPNAPLLDVRTPEEFSKGHLKYALNYNWNDENFNSQVAKLDKEKPVLVYCLSGGRSSSAANKLRKDGFKEVFELDGGIMKWRGENLPETTDNATKVAGMTTAQYNDLLNSDKIVLVDFYADWCGPCKKMKPYLEEIAKDMADKVVVVRINADDNQDLCKELKIDALPVLKIYKSKVLTWNNIGFIEKSDVVSNLK